MPHFDKNGNDTVLCQLCGRVVNSATWRPDLTGNKSAGNVCSLCVANPVGGRAVRRELEEPIGIYEHCRRESGLTGAALTRYVNRYYGHN